MDSDLYRKELWEEIKQALSCLYYLDEFRAGKAKIEPYYKGALSLVAIVAACVSFTDCSVLMKLMSILTATAALFPVLFTSLFPAVADFSKMDDLRIRLRNRMTELERFWHTDYTAEDYRDYLKTKESFSDTEAELSALFGKINRRIETYAISRSERYLQRFIAF